MPLSYVLITPAHNEEEFIELTIRSVIKQTILPRKWIIVDDGSSDRTAEIVGKYLPDNAWMELLQMPIRRERHFAGKAVAVNTAYEKMKSLDFDIVGNLDGDISFDSDFMEYLLGEFAQMPNLGVA